MGESLPTINQRVSKWALAHLGRKVGKGECWDLPEEALKNSGAQTSGDFGDLNNKLYKDYRWGKSEDLADIKRGDILQFRNHLVTTTTKSTYRFMNGDEVIVTQPAFAKRGPQHSAIADANLDADGSVRTFEQHVRPGGDVVQSLKLYTRDVPEVVTTPEPSDKPVFAKLKNPTTRKLENAKLTKTAVTITVSGKIWAYEPMAK